MNNISIDDKIACLKRELAMRKVVYPKLVEQEKLTTGQAEHEQRVMQAILDDYTAAAKNDLSHLPLFS